MASMSKSVAASAFKRSAPRPRKRGRQKSPHLSAALTAPRLRALHCAEHIGSAFKGGVNVCQRQLINEVLGPLVTEFVPNFGREGATPIQRGSNASLLHRVQAVKIIRHTACRHLQSRPHRRQSSVARTRFKTLIYLKGFGVGAWGRLGFNEQSFGADEPRTGGKPTKKHSAPRDAAGRKGPNSTSIRSANLPRPSMAGAFFPFMAAT